MAEEDYTAPTIEMYAQIFQKPKMTDKLLKKPPFRYLHDVFTATCKATNFGKGLFSGHMLDSKGITEKDDKLKFLTMLITLTELVIGEELDCKP
jgi:TRAF3-interacting protein 1